MATPCRRLPRPPRRGCSPTWPRPREWRPSTTTGAVATSSCRASTIVAVLRALGIDASDDAAAARALAQEADRPWRRLLPPVVVCREGWTPWVPVHLPHGDRPRSGSTWRTAAAATCARSTTGCRRGSSTGARWARRRTSCPATCRSAGTPWARQARRHHRHGRRWSSPPPGSQLPAHAGRRRAFGLMTQLYSVRSRRSWGVGDLADLGELAAWAAHDLGADFVLVNPLHAAEPVPPMEPSPYLPTTRRFVNPLYIRVEDIPEIGYVSRGRAPAAGVARRRRPRRSTPTTSSTATPSWQAKSAALRIVFQLPRSAPARARVRRVRRARGAGPGRLRHLVRARREARTALGRLARGAAGPPQRRRGRPRARTWPTRSLFHQWLQWVVDEQLGAVQQEPRHAGMAHRRRPRPGRRRAPRGRRRLGAAPTALARRVNVGAPPDPFNQMGQDWSQPPWRPDRLPGAGLRAVPRHAAQRAAPRRRHPGRPRHRPVPAVVGARGDDARTPAPTCATTTRR